MTENLRQIVFDTETTGLNPYSGHRVVEIGALEVINYVPTGKTYHQYINPERDIPEEAANIHGIDNDRVKDEPVFAQIVGDFIDFVGESDLVAHNAPFDAKFINFELKESGFPAYHKERFIDTLVIARKKFPGAKNNLNGLCSRFNIDNSARTYHGALLDSELLAEVYLELSGGRQQGLSLALDTGGASKGSTRTTDGHPENKQTRPIRTFAVSDEEQAAHSAMLKKISDPLWRELSEPNSHPKPRKKTG